jgi:hypothetical protein
MWEEEEIRFSYQHKGETTCEEWPHKLIFEPQDGVRRNSLHM